MGKITDFFSKKPVLVTEETPLSADGRYYDSEEQRQKAYMAQEARAENNELRKLDRERKKIERQIELERARADLQDLKDDLYGPEEEGGEEETLSPKEQMMMAFMQKIINPQQPQTQPQEQPPMQPVEPQPAPLSDEVLIEFAKKIPNYYKERIKQIRQRSKRNDSTRS